MLQVSNILCYDNSIQSETLRDACMIAVLASITMVLCWIDMYLHNNKKSTRRSTTYHCIKRKRRTIQLLHQEYECLFSRACRMNYKGFMALHDLLQQGIKELASDYLSFATSSLYQQLTQGSGLPNGYSLYGDNAYVNELYMSVPYPNKSSGPRDAYNYYQSQVQINIECAFGVLMNRWHLLKSPLSARIPINRINALTSCLCKIHNFCIDHGNAKPPQHYEHDLLTLMDFINNNDDDNPCPVGLLGGGEHFIDIPEGR